jgi:hypothetical protein
LTTDADAGRLIDVCGCPSDALCTLCLDGRFAQLRGVAACRGEAWADDLAQTEYRNHPWPVGSEKMRTIARAKVADIARDPKLLEMLVDELVKWAEKRWVRYPDESSKSALT